MARQLDEYLVRAIVDMAVFLEFSPETVLNMDASVEAMEQMAAVLRKMPEENRQAFIEMLRELAPTYGSRQQFVSELAENFGLASSGPN